MFWLEDWHRYHILKWSLIAWIRKNIIWETDQLMWALFYILLLVKQAFLLYLHDNCKKTKEIGFGRIWIYLTNKLEIFSKIFVISVIVYWLSILFYLMQRTWKYIIKNNTRIKNNLALLSVKVNEEIWVSCIILCECVVLSEIKTRENKKTRDMRFLSFQLPIFYFLRQVYFCLFLLW